MKGFFADLVFPVRVLISTEEPEPAERLDGDLAEDEIATVRSMRPTGIVVALLVGMVLAPLVFVVNRHVEGKREIVEREAHYERLAETFRFATPGELLGHLDALKYAAAEDEVATPGSALSESREAMIHALVKQLAGDPVHLQTFEVEAFATTLLAEGAQDRPDVRETLGSVLQTLRERRDANPAVIEALARVVDQEPVPDVPGRPLLESYKGLAATAENRARLAIALESLWKESGVSSVRADGRDATLLIVEGRSPSPDIASAIESHPDARRLIREVGFELLIVRGEGAPLMPEF